MKPEQAVQVAADVGAKLMLPVHWATFNLAFHLGNEPPDRAVAAAATAHASLVISEAGALVEPEQPPPLITWWK